LRQQCAACEASRVVGEARKKVVPTAVLTQQLVKAGHNLCVDVAHQLLLDPVIGKGRLRCYALHAKLEHIRSD
jgi:hypothetical protein